MKEGLKLTGAAIAGLIVAFVVVIVIASMGIFGWGFFQRSTAGFRGKTQAIEQTKANADFRLSSYDHFFDLCSSIQADEGRIKAQQTLTTSPDQNQADDARTNVAALQGSREAKVRQYNADASKDFTIGQFRSSKLPYRIDPNQENTQCTVD